MFDTQMSLPIQQHGKPFMESLHSVFWFRREELTVIAELAMEMIRENIVSRHLTYFQIGENRCSISLKKETKVNGSCIFNFFLNFQRGSEVGEATFMINRS